MPPNSSFKKTPPRQDHFLKRQLQWLLFLRVVVLSLLLGVNVLLQTTERAIIAPPLRYIASFIAGVYLLTIFSALLLNRIKRQVIFAYVQILTDAVLITLLVFFTGGSQSIFVSIYFFPVITASFILMRTGGMALAAVSTLCYGTILTTEYLGFYPNFFTAFWYSPLKNFMVAMNYFAIHGITFFLVAILSALLSERLRRAEKALTKTTLEFDRLTILYKQIFDDISTGIITIDNSGNITSFNKSAARISGYQNHEVINQPFADHFPGINLQTVNRQRPIINLTRKDGQKIPIACTCARLNIPHYHQKNSSEVFRVLTLQDMSEIKKMADQVRQAEKMAAIGEMAAGIAHEFRNPLAAISGSAHLLHQDLKESTPNSRLMEIIIRECTRMENNISDFLQFSKPARPEKEWLPLGNLIDDVVQLLRQTPNLKEHHTVSIDLPQKIDCWGDPQQIKRVLINILHNACLAIGGKNGEINISAREIEDGNGVEHTEINIADNGSGMPPEIVAKIFEPFFTTRENGTGLGLAIVKQIVDSHDGGITAASRQGKGTSFKIFLPLP